MVNLPKDELVRPIVVKVKQEGVYLTWRPPRDFPATARYKETWIVRSKTYDYEATNRELINRTGKIPVDKEWHVVEQPLIDRDVEPGTRYTYYLYVVDTAGNYYHPGPATGKVLEDGTPKVELWAKDLGYQAPAPNAPVAPTPNAPVSSTANVAPSTANVAPSTSNVATPAVSNVVATPTSTATQPASAPAPGQPDFDQKTRLFGMIKVEKQIDLAQASKIVRMPADEIKGLIYDLVGEGKIEGEFQGAVFVISSDVNNFIDALDDSFSDWSERDQITGGKV